MKKAFGFALAVLVASVAAGTAQGGPKTQAASARRHQL